MIPIESIGKLLEEKLLENGVKICPDILFVKQGVNLSVFRGFIQYHIDWITESLWEERTANLAKVIADNGKNIQFGELYKPYAHEAELLNMKSGISLRLLQYYDGVPSMDKKENPYFDKLVTRVDVIFKIID